MERECMWEMKCQYDFTVRGGTSELNLRVQQREYGIEVLLPTISEFIQNK